MNKKKEIEEMAKDLAKIQCNKKGCEDCEFYQFECDDFQHYTKIAELLYNAGYRKQSEGEWKEINKYNGAVATFVHDDKGKCGYVYKFYRHPREKCLKSLPNFCPNCGAKMTKGDKE